MWTCGICGKVFKSEHYLDLHLERVHMNETPRDGVCLADYCELFRVCQGDSKFRRRMDPEPKCDNVTLARAQSKCEAALQKCLPLEDKEAREMHAKLSRTFCRLLDCRIREE